MDRRAFLASTTAAAAVALLSDDARAQGAAAGDAALNATFDRVFNEQIASSPEYATQLGLDKGANAGLKRRLSPRTREEQAKDLARTKRAIATIEAVPTGGLSPAAKLNREVVLYNLAAQTVGPEKFGVGSPQRPFVITQQQGAYYSVPDFLNSGHTINTPEDAEAYLARLDQFGSVLDQETTLQREQAARGYLAPGFSLDLALGQMRKLRAPAAGETALVQSLVRRAAAKGVAGDWQGRAARIVETGVFPALDRQITAVEALRAKARTSAGVWDVPQGGALYAAALRQATTTDFTPEQVHQTGLRQVADLTAQLDAILKAQGLAQGSVGERLTALNADPAQVYANTAEGRAELIAGLNQTVAAMQAKLGRMMNNPPADPLEIRSVPVEIQDGASNGYYQRAALDGSRPAIYFINLKDVGDWPKYTLPSLSYHEGVPGHHLQISTMQRADLPTLRKVGGNSAYTEGWALYSEGVANELDGYHTPLERAGYLQSFLFRAARLVIDTGIHSKRWTREQATDYMVTTTGFPRARSQREVERYCAMPGQACSYKLGHNVWSAARARAEKALGPKFDIRDFHEVLRAGVVPLTVLDRLVDERIAAMRRA